MLEPERMARATVENLSGQLSSARATFGEWQEVIDALCLSLTEMSGWTQIEDVSKRCKDAERRRVSRQAIPADQR